MNIPFFKHKNKSAYQHIALNTSVFVCGAVLMIFELVGSRMFAPHLGTSTYVWTSLIGVILGFLSLGYWYGGKLADKNTSFEQYARILLWSALSLVFVYCTHDFFLVFFRNHFSQLEISAVLSAIVLFAPASFLLGIISPYAVRLKLVHIENSASTIGTLYAISTAGSIFGTFFSGFFLISHLGTMENLLLLSFVLALTPLLFFSSLSNKTRISTGILLFIVILFFFFNSGLRTILFQQLHYIDLDSEYSRIILSQSKDPATGKERINISTDPFGTEGAMFLSDDDLVFQIDKFYRLDTVFKPDLKKTLMIGGCGYSYPKEFLKTFPNATMDVIEIDPVMTELAHKYFRLTDDPRLVTYHEDARSFLNTSKNKYDVIYGDAFNSFSSVPFQLTTKEAIKHEYDLLNDDGVVLANLISAVDGKSGKFLQAEYATYKSVFPQVYIFPVQQAKNGTVVQNILLVALKSQKIPDFQSSNPERNEYLTHRWLGEIQNDLPILTDDFAPVDFYKRTSI